MPRNMLRRTPADPSTPPVTIHQQNAPPLRAAVPVFETPAGFQVPPDAVHPRRGVETFVGTLPLWHQPQRPAGFEALAAAGGVAAATDPGESTDGEGDPVDDDLEPEENEDVEIDDDLDEDGIEEVVEEDEDEEMQDRNKSPSPLPPNLREISALASWTVSTHKPGCGVAALRHPSPTQFWQSDGPQPHMLTLHFFKLVAIVKIRVYLDFVLDESYTPTKMMFMAGMGGNDLVEFASWEGEGPCGWVDIPLEGVGGRSGGIGHGSRSRRRRRARRARSSVHRSNPSDNLVPDDWLVDSSLEDEVDEDDDDDDLEDDPDNPFAGNVLKAMVLQVRVCENHQNGKDTHVRGFQVFAHDDDRRRVAATAAAAGHHAGHRRQSSRKSLRGRAKDSHDEQTDHAEEASGRIHGLEEPDWMGEPVIR